MLFLSLVTGISLISTLSLAQEDVFGLLGHPDYDILMPWQPVISKEEAYAYMKSHLHPHLGGTPLELHLPSFESRTQLKSVAECLNQHLNKLQILDGKLTKADYRAIRIDVSARDSATPDDHLRSSIQIAAAVEWVDKDGNKKMITEVDSKFPALVGMVELYSNGRYKGWAEGRDVWANVTHATDWVTPFDELRKDYVKGAHFLPALYDKIGVEGNRCIDDLNPYDLNPRQMWTSVMTSTQDAVEVPQPPKDVRSVRSVRSSK